ncbi:MAG: hypothetical protein HUU08_06350 [Candidatus Brocadia sp.]|nr:hypothetical protein [Candidatus Brocadia sp.]
MHSRFFVNLVNLVGWASPTKHLVHVACFLWAMPTHAHPTPYGKARLAATILYDIPSYAVRSFFYKKLEIHPPTLTLPRRRR